MPVQLVLDWDGTVTVTDGLHLLLAEFGEAEVFERAERELFRTLTLHQAIAMEFATVTAPLDEVVAWMVEHVEIRPGFAELAREHRPLILSSGFHELIEPILAREGVEGLEIRANRLLPEPTGWVTVWHDEAQCMECGEACKRGQLPPGEIVYVGDGTSDYCAAGAAARVFARAGLARHLERHGIPFEPFGDLTDVAEALR